MSLPERPALERRLLSALDSSPSRIPVLIGGCGSGRTSLLRRLGEVIGHSSSPYVDLEAVASTPERCTQAITGASPFPPAGNGQPVVGAREAFERLLGHLDASRAPGHEPATFLLDEFLEFRTFENFPGLRHVIREFITRIGESRNRFVLTSRYSARTLRVLRDAHARFEVIQIPPMSAAEIAAFVSDDDAAASVQALSAGRAAHAGAMANALAAPSARGLDPISALVSLMAPGGELAMRCRHSYELRLHRARGYGALKAILGVLSEEEGLTLTEIAQRLHRTPGSTKDYLSWLEDVDLVTATRKRYAFEDPLLRLYVRLYTRTAPPSEDDVAREVHEYALARLPQAAASAPASAPAKEPEPAMAGAGDDRNWGIIEID